MDSHKDFKIIRTISTSSGKNGISNTFNTWNLIHKLSNIEIKTFHGSVIFDFSDGTFRHGIQKVHFENNTVVSEDSENTATVFTLPVQCEIVVELDEFIGSIYDKKIISIPLTILKNLTVLTKYMRMTFGCGTVQKYPMCSNCDAVLKNAAKKYYEDQLKEINNLTNIIFQINKSIITENGKNPTEVVINVINPISTRGVKRQNTLNSVGENAQNLKKRN